MRIVSTWATPGTAWAASRYRSPELGEVVRTRAHEVVQRPRSDGRFAECADLLREVGVAGLLGLGHQLPAERGEPVRRGGVELLHGGSQVEDHELIVSVFDSALMSAVLAR